MTLVTETIRFEETAMDRTNAHRSKRRMTGLPAVLMAALAATWLALLPATGMAAEGHGQVGFETPDLAVQALVEATRADQVRRMVEIFGAGGHKLVFSGDPVADKLGREKFLANYDKAHRIESQSATQAVLVIGEHEWPFPIPLVKHGASWRFDTRAGIEEIIDRRIGRNERGAIEVCRAYVDAQRDYAATVRRGDGILEYAQHFLSTPAQHDGLYWPAAAGEPESPMGPLMASARAEGYAAGDDDRHPHAPYHGYFFKILKRQGSHAQDGARDYLVDGRMIGGFALVAFPARYGDSGVMTFIVNHDGVVYEKNLGRHTEAAVRGMTEFDPDPSWSKVPSGTAH
jgi:hypothetical protein